MTGFVMKIWPNYKAQYAVHGRIRSRAYSVQYLQMPELMQATGNRRPRSDTLHQTGNSEHSTRAHTDTHMSRAGMKLTLYFHSL